MADNTTVTPGTGLTVATDDVSGTHYQRVKLVDGTLDSSAAIPGDATNGLDVDVTRVSGTVTVSYAASATATLANVSTSTTNATLQASNANRKGLVIYNDSSAILYVKFGATASATSFTYMLVANSHLELPMPLFSGIVDGILSAGTGTARVTELT